MRSYAASEWTVLRKVRIPNALPYFFTALKVATTLSLIGAIVGEYFGGSSDVARPGDRRRAPARLKFDVTWARHPDRRGRRASSCTSSSSLVERLVDPVARARSAGDEPIGVTATMPQVVLPPSTSRSSRRGARPAWGPARGRRSAWTRSAASRWPRGGVVFAACRRRRRRPGIAGAGQRRPRRARPVGGRPVAPCGRRPAAATSGSSCSGRPQAQFAGYFAAEKQGYFAAENLTVTMVPGGPDVVPQVEGSKADGPEFTISWVPKVLEAREAATPSDLVDIAQIFQRSGTLSVTWKDTGHRRPVQARRQEGRRRGTSATSSRSPPAC